MTSLIIPRETDVWSLDGEGIWTTSKHKDSTVVYPIDLFHWLPSARTISTVTAKASGVTVSSGPTITSGINGTNTEFTMTIVGSSGSVDITTTDSAGDIRVWTFRFLPTPRGNRDDDYPTFW